jgi:phosphatidylglycerophosphate synthase
MDHAILVAAGTGIDKEKLSLFPQKILCGVPQLLRLIIMAERIGIRRFTIIVEEEDPSLKELVRKDKRIKSEIVWHKLGSSVKLEEKPCLILQSNLVINTLALSSLLNCSVKSNEIAMLVEESKDAWVKTRGSIVEEVFLEGGKAVGAFVAYGNLLEKSILNSLSLKSWVEELAGREGVKAVKVSDGYWMRLSSSENSVKKAEKLLFSYVGKTETGWISRNINSKISIPTSKLLVRTPLTPNMISVTINLIGMLCGLFYALGHPVIGALFLQIATILDRCDGEVARVKLMETKRGQWIDTICDQLTILSFIIGVPLGYYRISENPWVLALGGLNLTIFLFFVIWSFYFLIKYTNSGSLVAYFNVDKIIGEKNKSLIRRLIVLIRPMARRNFYSLSFLILAIIGGYPLVLGTTSIALILFLVHQVEDIIKLRRLKPANTI